MIYLYLSLRLKAADDLLLFEAENILPGERGLPQLGVRVAVHHHLLKGGKEVGYPECLQWTIKQ